MRLACNQLELQLIPSLLPPYASVLLTMLKIRSPKVQQIVLETQEGELYTNTEGSKTYRQASVQFHPTSVYARRLALTEFTQCLLRFTSE